MEKTLLKSSFHQLIDETDDEIMLENLYNALHNYRNATKDDFLDELSTMQYDRLKSSMKQVQNGESITNDVMKLEVQRWFTK